MIDYPYIGFGVVGFFFLIYGQHDRNAYWDRVSQTIDETYYWLNRQFTEVAPPKTAKHPAPPLPRVASTIGELRFYIADLRAYHCEEADEEYKALSKEFCVLVSDITNFLNSDNPYEAWPTMVGNLHKFADDNRVTGPEAPGGLSFVPNSLNKPTPLGPLMVLSPEYHRRYWYKYELSRETAAIFK